MNNKEFQDALASAVEARGAWLEKNEFPKLKEECRNFHNSFSIIYNQLIQKRLIHEDPYKQEAKAGEIKVPAPIKAEGDKTEQLTVNLSAYDNQLDFLVNFSQFSLDFLTNENIKRILALIKYIDWTKFSVDTPNSTTKAVVDVTIQAKTGADPLALRVFGDALTAMDRSSAAIMGYLKTASNFNRELYKLELRQNLTGTMHAGEAALDNIKRKFTGAMPGRPFYPDLVNEVIKEDFTPGGEKIRETILKQLVIPENKPKIITKEVSFKSTLFDGFMILSAVSVSLGEIAAKFDENNLIFQNRKQSFLARLRVILRQMMSKEPEPVIYNIEYMDTAKGVPVKELINFTAFRGDIDRKIRSYNGLGGRGGVSARLEAMEEKQLLQLLERAIRDAQSIHKTLTGLDEYFKTEVPKESRDKIKGIKPELSAMKNAIIKANQRRHEYSAQMEEEEQLKKLGVKA